jgi:hypothetical protein
VNRSSFGAVADDIDNLFRPNGVIYAGPIRHDFGDVPYIDEWFRAGIGRSPSNFVCFINSHILLSTNWLIRAKQVFHLMTDRPIFVIGQRIDFDLDPVLFHNLAFEESLLQQIDTMVEKSHHSIHRPSVWDI